MNVYWGYIINYLDVRVCFHCLSRGALKGWTTKAHTGIYNIADHESWSKKNGLQIMDC